MNLQGRNSSWIFRLYIFSLLVVARSRYENTLSCNMMIFSNIYGLCFQPIFSKVKSEAKDDFKHFVIDKSWNGTDLPPESQTLFILKPYKTNDTHSGLYIYFNAPFYNDPVVPEDVPVGTVDKLWNYEVFELFLLAEGGNYLEIELAPKGHYLLLVLNSNRDVLEYGLKLENYKTLIDASETAEKAGRWHAGTFIPCRYFPGKLQKFNAYSIHKSGSDRFYTALFPSPLGKYDQPDFHRIEYFQDIGLMDACGL